MRKLHIFFIFILLLSCVKEELKKPEFLFGYWIRENEKVDRKTYEIWKENHTGLGFTLQNNDTIFKEILSIVEIKDSLFLKVESVNEAPRYFKFTQLTDTSFTCENPKNEFPQKIKYWIEQEKLKAKVWNDEKMKIEFSFQKSL